MLMDFIIDESQMAECELFHAGGVWDQKVMYTDSTGENIGGETICHLIGIICNNTLCVSLAHIKYELALSCSLSLSQGNLFPLVSVTFSV